jgi:hypothetical protein
MRPPFRKILTWSSSLVGVVIVTYFVSATYLRFKVAKMHSQCSVLAAEIGHASNQENRRFDLRTFLETCKVDGVRGLIKTAPDNGALLDAWGHPLLFEGDWSSGGKTVVVVSTGRDGVRGTQDDFERTTKLAPP